MTDLNSLKTRKKEVDERIDYFVGAELDRHGQNELEALCDYSDFLHDEIEKAVQVEKAWAEHLSQMEVFA